MTGLSKVLKSGFFLLSIISLCAEADCRGGVRRYGHLVCIMNNVSSFVVGNGGVYRNNANEDSDDRVLYKCSKCGNTVWGTINYVPLCCGYPMS